MRRDLTRPIAPAPLPPGISLPAFDETTARACRDLMNRVYAAGFGDPEPFDVWWPQLTADDQYDPALMFVAADDGQIVGFCHCWTVPFIKDVVIDPTYRRRGLGAALLTSAMAASRQRGGTSIDLKTDVDNFAAQSLYRRLGFEIVERIG